MKKHEYYRLITADLVHNDISHLLFNEVSLYVFGATLEEFLNRSSVNGSNSFLIIFFMSGITGNVLATIRNRKDHRYMSAGCSGSVMGCLFSFMLIDPNGQAVSLYVIGGIKNIFTGLIYIFLLMFYSWKRPNDLVNHEIHFYGAIGGILCTLGVFHQMFF